jgi:hypothetical protein
VRHDGHSDDCFATNGIDRVQNLSVLAALHRAELRPNGDGKGRKEERDDDTCHGKRAPSPPLYGHATSGVEAARSYSMFTPSIR